MFFRHLLCTIQTRTVSVLLRAHIPAGRQREIEKEKEQEQEGIEGRISDNEKCCEESQVRRTTE